MLKQTPLIQRHREANAKLVDFSGWEMPIHYGSQLDEHHIVRSDAGMFDVSHMLPVDLKGEGARAFLRQLVPTMWTSSRPPAVPSTPACCTRAAAWWTT